MQTVTFRQPTSGVLVEGIIVSGYCAKSGTEHFAIAMTDDVKAIDALIADDLLFDITKDQIIDGLDAVRHENQMARNLGFESWLAYERLR